jgi:peptidyl-prolyl cis-trans isomerase C
MLHQLSIKQDFKMIFKPARLLIALLAVVALPALAQNVAVVNGKSIPTSRVEAVVKQVVAQGQQADSPQLREMIKKDLIGREVMMQEAEKQGFGKDSTVKQQIESARQAIIINVMVEEFLTKNPVSDADIKAEYDRFTAQSGDKEYHVRHILLETEAAAKDVIVKLKGGAQFEELAKTSKDTGSASNGGDLDWVTPSSFPKPFSDAFVNLQKGQFTQVPVKTQNGFHVIKIDDIRSAKLPTMEEVKPQISEALQQKKLQAYQDEMMKKAKIQ